MQKLQWHRQQSWARVAAGHLWGETVIGLVSWWWWCWSFQCCCCFCRWWWWWWWWCWRQQMATMTSIISTMITMTPTTMVISIWVGRGWRQRVRILVVTEVMSSDTNGDADRKNMTKPLKHTSMSQPWVFSIAIVSHDFHEFPWQPCSRSNNNLIRLAFFLAILEENPILARILERLGSNQCRCANGLAPHLWIRHWMASVWRGSWIVMAIPRLFDESTSKHHSGICTSLHWLHISRCHSPRFNATLVIGAVQLSATLVTLTPTPSWHRDPFNVALVPRWMGCKRHPLKYLA